MPRNEDQETPDPQPRTPDARPASGSDIPDLPYVRLTQRGRPSQHGRFPWVLLGAVLVGHALLGWLAFVLLRPSFRVESGLGILHVTLIEPPSEVPAAPPSLPPPPLSGSPQPAAPTRRIPYEPPAPGAITATLEGGEAPQLDLYGANGQIRLPPSSAPAASAPAYRTPALKGSRISSGESPVPYKPTRFNKAWAPDHQSLGAQTVGRALEQVVEKTTVTRTVHLPGGVDLHCVVSPLLLAFGCPPAPPPPPPDNGNDVRRSLPPAATLAGKPVVAPKPASTTAPSPASSVATPPSQQPAGAAATDP